MEVSIICLIFDVLPFYFICSCFYGIVPHVLIYSEHTCHMMLGLNLCFDFNLLLDIAAVVSSTSVFALKEVSVYRTVLGYYAMTGI